MLVFDFATFTDVDIPMAKRIGPITYHAEDGHTLQDWRDRWPEILVTRNDQGVTTVHAMMIGSESRGALWHLKDYYVIGVSTLGVHLAPKAVV